jgi:thiol-disulfide isomerase/thioredoxin
MKKSFLLAVVFPLLAIDTFKANGASVGDPAPPVTIERWVKGAPVRIGRGTNLFVVEFWATWCGPCKRSIPHLTALQKKYADKGVVFIGISDEPLTDVIPFVASQGDNMAYRVGVDTSRRTYNSWMTAYGENGIPHAFIVNTNGIVVWHNFPNERLDSALDDLIAGRFDIQHEKKRESGMRLIQQYTGLVSRSDAAVKAAPLGDKILSDYAVTWLIPYYLAEAILTDTAVRSRDVALALRATTRAVEMTRHESCDALAMHARALYANGKKPEAVETQKQAIALCNDPEDRAELEKFLALFQRGAR